MLRLSYEEIKQKIREEKGVSDSEIEDKVKQKLSKLSGLISKEGAAHIVANELGIKLFPDPQKKKYKIKEIMSGLRGVEITGRIVRKYEVRSFNKEGREGRVASLLIGDDTGVLRVVLWDENHIKQTEKLQENDLIKIVNAYAKENQGFKELHLGNKSEIILNPEGEDLETIKKVRDFSQKKIDELQVGDLVKVMGTVVDVYSPKFYEACPECNKKINLDGDKKTCTEHGTVNSKFVPILNLIFDDGTGNIRVVCFRETAAKALNQTEEQVQAYREDSTGFETVKEEIRGRHLMITGRVTKNEMFDRLEFVAHDIAMINPKTLLAEIH